ncbi:NAD(P)H-dependent oxidoreductase [Roseibium salinum]|nr:NAD(P)H-dependent oxidoreductase [Roseibium salinum]
MHTSLRIGLIQGSIRDGRFNDTITNWAAKRLRQQGFDVRIIDPPRSGAVAAPGW